MEKVQHITEHVFIKAYTDSEWDNCSFAIIYLSDQWKELLTKRSGWLIPFNEDSSFYCLTYWDRHVDFFINTDKEGENSLYTEDILDENEEWAYVEVTEEEIDRFSQPENKIRAHQLKISQGGHGKFVAWGDHTGEEFYTEQFSIDALIK